MSEATNAKVGRDPAIARELKLLDNNIALLDETARTLFGKIVSVVRCEPETTKEKKEKEGSPDLTCEMANTLSCFSRRINAVREQVEHQISIIEL